MMMTSEDMQYRNEIIEMARQADVWTEKDFMFADVLNSKIEAFAKLIDAKATAREREACAKLAWDYGWKRVDSDDAQGAAVEITDLIRARGATE